ncbi:E3 ubiquitin-protein ligase TRIM39-like isoform X1 [Melanerpes formicivorus]|uniref:E3 ubiquitin-protein ligase TRIM39-like isoform X1 n=1 Tax=Melanerpes formicivorus TaxID=211600 RepID=UPI00358E18D4
MANHNDFKLFLDRVGHPASTTSELWKLSQQMKTLQKAVQDMQESTQRDLQSLKEELGKKVELSTTGALGSLQQLSQQMETLLKAVQNVQTVQEATCHDLQILRAELQNNQELFRIQRYQGDVTLDADTAHPRLEISEAGKSVKDTGALRDVPRNDLRFDSHLFVLAKEGYTSGRHYWQVDVGRRKSWTLGVARESVSRKGALTLSPENGFWAIGLVDGRDCWAFVEPWSRLSVGGRPQKIGLFLDVSAKQLSVYDVHKKRALHTFTIAGGSSQAEKFFPFFSTGLASGTPEDEPLSIVQDTADDD